MELRKIYLRVMLWSLGVAAAAGVLGVLLATGKLLPQVAGTAAATAIAAGLMWPLAILVDRQTTRNSGLLGMGSVIVIYLLVVALIWELVGRWDDEVSISAAIIGLMSVPAMFMLRLMHVPRCYTASWVGLGVSTLATLAFLALPWPWWGRRYMFDDELIATGFGILGYGAVIVAALIGWDLNDRRYWRWPGVVVAVVALVTLLAGIWVYDKGDPTFLVVLSGLAFAVAHANLALLTPVKSTQRWLILVAIAAVAMTVIGLDFIVAWKIEEMQTSIVRLTAASAIVAGCASLALMVLARLNRQVDLESPESALVEMTIHCPRCHKKQTVPLGESHCSGCELRIFIRVEEPRCPQCGYLLYMLTSNTCPECGAAVRPAAVTM